MFCINKNLTDIFLKKVKSGEINPEKMASMTSKERRDYFTTFLGETNAKQVNALFESKLLLKDQQQGIINWAKKVSGLSPEAQRDIISRVNKMEQVLTPESEQAFLEDLAAHKLGVTVTMEEAGNISALAKDVSEKKAAIATGGNRLEYGRAKVAFDDYVNDLKSAETKKSILDYAKFGNWGEGISIAAGLAKSLKASLDNSVIGRQGLKVLFSHPDTWLKNSKQSFVDMVDTFGGKEVLNEVRADVMSRPNALNGLYKKEKLAVGVQEEAYPVHISEKIPVIGKAFKASEAAFTAFQYRTRADIFDKYVDIAEKAGADIEGLGRLANSLTGRGNLEALEPAANITNNLLFSPRFLKSNLDTLSFGLANRGKSSAFIKKAAAINTLKIIGGVAVVLAIAKAVNPDSVELDPRSSDFGKIKVGNTRFDVSGGMASIITLAARIIHPKPGSQSGTDTFINFMENKASPTISVLIDILNHKDRQGNLPSLAGEANNLLTPLPIANYLELKNDPNSANTLVAMIADSLGISTNTYKLNAKAEEKTLRQTLQDEADKGNFKPLQDAVDRGDLSEKQAEEIQEKADEPPIERQYKHLGIDAILKKSAPLIKKMSAEDKDALRQMLDDKYGRMQDTQEQSPKEIERIENDLEEFYKKYEL